MLMVYINIQDNYSELPCENSSHKQDCMYFYCSIAKHENPADFISFDCSVIQTKLYALYKFYIAKIIL